MSDEHRIEDPSAGEETAPETTAGSGRPSFMGPELVVGADRPGAKDRLRGALPMLGVFVVGIGLGVGGTLLVTSGEETAAVATTEAGAAAGPDDGAGAPAITLPSVGTDDPDAYGTVEITGTPLPRFTGQGDPTIGRPAPELRGFDFEGNPVEITDDGRAKIVLFLAHWCPYCAQEVPIVRDWYAGGDLPDGVDVYTVATLTDITRSNYPPRTWLESQAWNVPVVVDDAFDTAATAFGLNAVPFWVMIEADGTIAMRHAGGGVPAEALDQVAAELSTASG